MGGDRCTERELPQLLALGSTQGHQLAILRTREDEPTVSRQNTPAWIGARVHHSQTVSPLAGLIARTTPA